jgi:uncharacterized protein (DUF2252 family)
MALMPKRARPAWIHPSHRKEQGRLLRKSVPRTGHAVFEPRPDRDPIAMLEAQEADRLPDLIGLRHARMAESPFAFYRGAAAVMAFDLESTPRTEIIVQASGDAHLANFGLFASPERTLVFDTNDFDETLPAPWEWDLKRLAVSIVLAGRANGFSPARNRAATLATVRSYREWMTRYAWMGLINVLYAHITADDIRQIADPYLARLTDDRGRRAKMERVFSKAETRDELHAAGHLTTVVDGRRVINDHPPVVQHVGSFGTADAIRPVFDAYRATMTESRRRLLDRYRFADAALKVVGVGSVGTRCYVIVLEGRDENDVLVLQAKQATASVLERPGRTSALRHHGQRVVIGQQLMQATSDTLLGWTRGIEGRDFYVRQLWDMKGSLDLRVLQPPGLGFYGALCAWALAGAHARSGDSVAISAYAGSSDTLDGAIGDFAEAYADHVERDHRAYKAAIQAGRVSGPAPRAPEHAVS